MISFARSSENVYMARDMCEALVALKSVGSGANLDHWLRGHWQGEVSSDRTGREGITPTWARINIGNVTVVAILGVESAEITDVVAGGWLAGNTGNGSGGIHEVAWDTSLPMRNAVQSQDEGNRERIVVVAHSWGGVVGMALFYRLMGDYNGNNDRRLSLITFGSPKSHLMAQRGWCGGDFTRWQNDGDFCTLAPPTPTQAPILHGLLSDTISRRVQGWGQLHQAKTLTEEGVIYDATTVSSSGAFADLSLVRFLHSNEADTARAHNVSTYAGRLDLAIRRLASAAPPQVSNQPNQQVAAVNNQQVPVVNVAPMPNAPRAPIEPRQPVPLAATEPVVMPGSQVSHKIFTVGRSGALYTVLGNGTPLAIARRKASAQKVCNRLNDSIKSWSKLASRDPATLASILESELS